MLIPKESIETFKEIWKRTYNEEITDAQAQEYGSRLVRLIELVSQPLPKEGETRGADDHAASK